MPFLLPMSEKVNRKLTVLKVLLLAGCAKGKGSMVEVLLCFLERYCLKCCLLMPGPHQDFPCVPHFIQSLRNLDKADHPESYC